MFGSAEGLKVEFFEEKSIVILKNKVNDFLNKLAEIPADILDIKYISDREEYGKHFTAMIVYREI